MNKYSPCASEATHLPTSSSLFLSDKSHSKDSKCSLPPHCTPKCFGVLASMAILHYLKGFSEKNSQNEKLTMNTTSSIKKHFPLSILFLPLFTILKIACGEYRFPVSPNLLRKHFFHEIILKNIYYG